MSKSLIITDCDLDGAGCYFILQKALDNKTELYVSSVTDIKNDLTKLSNNNSFNNYTKVFICDISLSEDLLPIVNNEKFVIIDHHETHVPLVEKYTECVSLVKNYSSCTKLILDNFGSLRNKLTKHQVILTRLIDDYDSYQLKYESSRKLNRIFWSYTGKRTEKFILDFSDGFYGFNTFQQNAIKIIDREIKDILNSADHYIGNIPIKDKQYKIVSIFCDKHTNEIAEILLNDYNADVCILFNIKKRSVNFRKNKKVDLNLAKLAEKLADGGGHANASGGKITKEILTLTKNLKPNNG